MSLRTRLDRLERQGGGGLPCPGCGWRGPIAYFTEYADAAGRVVRLEDFEGNPLPGFPAIPSCDRCKHEIKYIAVRHSAGGACSWRASP